MIRFSLLMLGLCLSSMMGNAFELNYKPSQEAATAKWGSGKTDTYDVAVHLAEPSLVGRTITGFSVPLTSTGTQNIKGWLSSKLSLKKVSGVNSNNPDILCQDAEIADDVLSVTFSEPYTLTAQGVYVGYSFQVVNADDEEGKKPVTCYTGINPEGFWVHTRKSVFQWTSMSDETNCVSAMTINVEGQLQPYAVSVKQVSETYAAQGQDILVDALISNHGSQPVSSFTYEYTVGGEKHEGTYTFDEPLSPLYMASKQVALPVSAPQNKGEYEGALAITKVDGNVNPEEENVQFPLYVLSFTPHKTVVMEELTGTWCGWCPRGLACMEHLTADYPDNFLAIAYHSDDVMSTSAGDPVNSSSLPYCALDRSYKGDPGYPNILPRFMTMADARPIANIDVTASLEGEKITCKSSVIFARSMNKAAYRIAYMLLADGLHSPQWVQSNSYSGLQDRAEQDSYLQYFIDSPSAIPNMLYKDVMVYCKDIKGISGSVPTEIIGDTSMEHTFLITLSNVVNLVGESLMQDDATYRVAALLIDNTTGLVVNAAQCPVSGLTDTRDIITDEEKRLCQNRRGLF